MSDLFYRQAVTEDGEPVAVTENYDPQDGYTVAPSAGWLTRPCSWALILPGDTVRYQNNTFTVTVYDHDDPTCSVMITGPYADWTTPEDLTLVCGEPSELRRQNPAWRWD